jgi:hypothetical protein
MNKNNHFIEQMLAGSSLRTVMTPDDDIPRNQPLHDEGFDLPHVVISGETFYGITDSSLFTVFNKPQLPVSFYYSNQNDIFGSFSPENVFTDKDHLLRFHIASKKRYKHHQWIFRNSSSLIWEHTGKKQTGLLRDAIRSSRKLTVGFLDEENVWNIHPVALPQMNRNDDAFVLKTHYTIYPYVFRNPAAMTDLIQNNVGKEYFDNKSEYQSHFKLAIHHPFIAFYHLYPDGTYQSFYDLQRGNTKNTYLNLRIFAEQMDSVK